MGTMEVADRSKQEQLSRNIQETHERNKRVQLVNHLQQLRLRAPNILQREYSGLLSQVKGKDDIQEEDGEVSESDIKTTLTSVKPQKMDDVQRRGGLVKRSRALKSALYQNAMASQFRSASTSNKVSQPSQSRSTTKQRPVPKITLNKQELPTTKPTKAPYLSTNDLSLDETPVIPVNISHVSLPEQPARHST